MSLRTNWGYSIKTTDTLEDMLTAAEYADFTAGKYRGDQRVSANIKAASDAVRNYCGWHVYPPLECEMATSLNNQSVAKIRSKILVQLPARYVTKVEAVTVNGKECRIFDVQPNGMLKIYDADVAGLPEYAPITVTYKAGLPDGLMGGVKELIAHRITHALASSSGVQSETAGGVSITYSANWINSARATALADDNKEVLAPFKLQGVF